MSAPTIVDTSYSRGGSGALLDYMERDGDEPLRDRHGRELDDVDRERFEAKSRDHRFTRSFVVSPGNGRDLSDREMSRRTRETMNETLADRPNTDYCYSIHRDTDNPHVHVAATGPENSLYMDNGDLDNMKENAHEKYVERGNEQRLDLGRDGDRGGRSVAEDARGAGGPERQADREQDVRDRDRGRDMGVSR